jgi:protein gp37
MAAATHIEWTEMTWNPVRGCTRVSEGCRHCYAERLAGRFCGTGNAFEGVAHRTASGARWTNQIRLLPESLDLPKRWRQPKTIFVNSMSDLFHEDVPVSFIRDVFRTIELCPQHTFQVLTKRSNRLATLANELFLPGNLWLGVSVEDQNVVHRVHDLASVPAAVRFLSVEPLIGEITRLPLDGIHWVIVGGESGPGARPMRPEWVESIYEQCRAHDVAFFFKQWGGVRKGKAGRMLHDRTYDELPARTPRILSPS